MFVTALHLAHWIACIPFGAGGVPGVAAAAVIMPITPKNSPKTAYKVVDWFLRFAIDSAIAAQMMP